MICCQDVYSYILALKRLCNQQMHLHIVIECMLLSLTLTLFDWFVCLYTVSILPNKNQYFKDVLASHHNRKRVW